jgi:type II restriction enzyme
MGGRGDTADVEACTKQYCFVADAKSFRLSRTAKNQKDFKVQALDGWRRDKQYAMLVCPIYQLPAKSSQIYQQASARNICIFTYSHLAVLVAFSTIAGNAKAQEVLHRIFKRVPALNPSKDATEYWRAVNRTLLGFSRDIDQIWHDEKIAAMEAIAAAKQ